MSYRRRIVAWVVFSCSLLVGVMIFTGYRQLEEELRQGRTDPTHPAKSEWVIHNSYAEAEIQDILSEMVRTWIWTALILIGLSLGVGLLLARRSLRPMHDINRQLSAMPPNSLHGDIIIPESDPAIEDLTQHLNDLLNRAGTAYQEMAEFSARVAHELRTPLMLLRMRVEHAPPGMPPALQEDLQDELSRLARFVERVLQATRAERGSLLPVGAPLDLSECLRDITNDYQLLADERGIQMNVTIQPSIRITVDRHLLLQALHGLMENAVRYAKSKIDVSCRVEKDVAILEIHNDHEPATAATAGLGMGLRLVRGLCKTCAWQVQTEEGEHDFRASLHLGAIIPLALWDRNI